MNILTAIKLQRRQKKLKQKDLGAKLGLPQSHISKIEAGVVDPRLSTIADMARILDLELVLVPRTLILPVEALIYGEEEDEPRWKPDEGDA